MSAGGSGEGERKRGKRDNEEIDGLARSVYGCFSSVHVR